MGSGFESQGAHFKENPADFFGIGGIFAFPE